MDTPGLTVGLNFRCWHCRQPFPATELLIFTSLLPEELRPIPAEEGHYQVTMALAYLCRDCTALGMALTQDDMHAAVDRRPDETKESPDEHESVPASAPESP